MRRGGDLLALKMVNYSMSNLEINSLEGPDSLINFALSVGFDERLLLPRPGPRIWEELEYQRIITSQSVVQLPEHLPTNRPYGFLEYNVPKAAIAFEIFFGAFGAGHLPPPFPTRDKVVMLSPTLRALRQDQSRSVKDGGRPVWPPT